MCKTAPKPPANAVRTAAKKPSSTKKDASSAPTADTHDADRPHTAIMNILLRNLRIYAYHGVMPQEETVGAWYTINLRLTINDEQATQSDLLVDTVSYADVYNMVCHEMQTHSRLIEHVCGRICRSLLHTFPQIDRVWISMLKGNPPIGADCDGCGVELEMSR